MPDTRDSIQEHTTSDLITNDTLRRLARGESTFWRGEISAELQAMLCMILPDLAGELLARRAAEAITRAGPPRHHVEEIALLRGHEARP